MTALGEASKIDGLLAPANGEDIFMSGLRNCEKFGKGLADEPTDDIDMRPPR